MVELTVADDAELNLRAKSGRGEDRLEAMQGDELAHEQHVEPGFFTITRSEESVFSTDVANGNAFGEQPEPFNEVPRMGCGIRDHEVCAAEGRTVDQSHRRCKHGASSHELAIADHGVLERHEWVEHDWPIARDSLRRKHVEVSGIADDQDVRVQDGTECEPRFSADRPDERTHLRGKLVALRFPERNVSLEHLDTRSAQACHHLGVARIFALVRTEVENLHRPG
ncbi:MAG: hypothetical protein M3364_01960 [Actinomycetota bacterium]|nr:hypothetical protein [Actinomycetota bacterium]